jgi:hypothetical protein
MSDPRYTVTYEQRPTYLVARIVGDRISGDIKVAYFTEIAAECRARGLRKMLVIETLQGSITEGEMARLAVQVAPLVKGIICAYVDTMPDRQGINRLGEHLSVDAGAVGRMFRTIPEAEHWIAAVP